MFSSTKKTIKQPVIYLVDQDENALASLSSLLAPLNATILSFTSAESLLRDPGISHASCMLIEANLQDTQAGGIDLLENLVHQGHHIPTIIVASMGDIPTAVRAMQAGAIDFFEKPYIEHLLVKEVKTILQQHPNYPLSQ
ncbi:MAG: two-component system response regulator FixJ [Paraglaciecola sp.]|jgi:two-component system response regulator FixJ